MTNKKVTTRNVYAYKPFEITGLAFIHVVTILHITIMIQCGHFPWGAVSSTVSLPLLFIKVLQNLV